MGRWPAMNGNSPACGICEQHRPADMLFAGALVQVWTGERFSTGAGRQKKDFCSANGR
jgi:hypothetical protein